MIDTLVDSRYIPGDRRYSWAVDIIVYLLYSAGDSLAQLWILASWFNIRVFTIKLSTKLRELFTIFWEGAYRSAFTQTEGPSSRDLLRILCCEISLTALCHHQHRLWALGPGAGDVNIGAFHQNGSASTLRHLLLHFSSIPWWRVFAVLFLEFRNKILSTF